MIFVKLRFRLFRKFKIFHWGVCIQVTGLDHPIFEGCFKQDVKWIHILMENTLKYFKD